MSIHRAPSYCHSKGMRRSIVKRLRQAKRSPPPRPPSPPSTNPPPQLQGMDKGHHASPFPVPPLGSKVPLSPVGGDGGEAGGIIVGQYWGDEGAEDNAQLVGGGGARKIGSRDTRRWKRQSSATERGAKAEEEEQERKERTPPHMVRNPCTINSTH